MLNAGRIIWRIRRNAVFFVTAAVCFFASCTELRRPDPNPYLSETQPPPIQELRWCNGGMPTSLDPALASGAPETDVVRAVYEGLTRIDERTLDAAPGVAEKWQVSDDGLEWTFYIRGNARWSNGRQVTSGDFVRSWQRLYDLGEAGAHGNLLNNLAVSVIGSNHQESLAEDFQETSEAKQNESKSNTQAAQPSPSPARAQLKTRLTVSAPDSQTLMIKLRYPDPDLPKLVAHPIFMPVNAGGSNFDAMRAVTKIVSNGPFRITEANTAGIVLERSDTYWNAENVNLERLRFVAISSPEDALEAYRAGKIDVLTNTEISPLAQKVFSTASDFKKNSFAALNFYEINYRKPPFNDRRVREALSISIEREALVAAIGETTAQPAVSFLPFGIRQQKKIVQDKDRAQELLEQAGFPDGRGFAPIKLTVNRNDTQLRVARAVAKMWKDNLNVETTLEIRETGEIDAVRQTGDFDVLRRGVVFPVPDELASIAAIDDSFVIEVPGAVSKADHDVATIGDTNSANSNSVSSRTSPLPGFGPIQTEADALYQLHSIPLYFPTSFSLVKPYVNGFQMNSLDAPDLSEIAIDTSWQPPVR